MSLTGITFANQKITPSDDGRLYGAFLSDGILSGCGISFAAATLTIAAGSMLIGSRELRTSGETLSITGATSGYARVIIDIDLTRAATKTSFEQAQFKIQYAASVSAFPALIQRDINSGGTAYQAAICVVSLGAAGITGIVSKIENAIIPIGAGGTGANTKAGAIAKLGALSSAAGAVGTSNLGSKVVTTDKIANGAITNALIAAGGIERGSLAASALGNASGDLSATPFAAENNGRLLIFASDSDVSYTLTQTLWNSLNAGFSVTILKANSAASGKLTINWENMAGVYDFTRGTVYYNETKSLTLKRRGDMVTFEKWGSTTRLLISGNFNTPNFYKGTSATPPSTWQPGDIYLQYK